MSWETHNARFRGAPQYLNVQQQFCHQKQVDECMMVALEQHAWDGPQPGQDCVSLEHCWQ